MPLSVLRCKECGCTDENCAGCIARTGRACGWVAEDLCSACVGEHDFDPHPDALGSCALCGQPPSVEDPICLISRRRLEELFGAPYEDLPPGTHVVEDLDGERIVPNG